MHILAGLIFLYEISIFNDNFLVDHSDAFNRNEKQKWIYFLCFDNSQVRFA